MSDSIIKEMTIANSIDVVIPPKAGGGTLTVSMDNVTRETIDKLIAFAIKEKFNNACGGKDKTEAIAKGECIKVKEAIESNSLSAGRRSGGGTNTLEGFIRTKLVAALAAQDNLTKKDARERLKSYSGVDELLARIGDEDKRKNAKSKWTKQFNDLQSADDLELDL